MDLPKAFLQRIGEQLGNELPDFLKSFEEEAVRGIRYNPWRGAETWIQDAEERVPWMPDARYLKMGSEAGNSVEHTAGAFYIQDPSAMIAAEVLGAQPGERVMDLCAAPGGKSTQLGLRMAGRGLLVCNEPVPKRAKVLRKSFFGTRKRERPFGS